MSFKISYAQNREDYIIEGFFPDIKGGFYVDVGANDPTEDSVTKIFYQKGWRGINIEPVEEKIKLLKKHRPKDINIGVGVADKTGELSFREYIGAGMSTFSESLKDAYKEDKNPNLTKFIDIIVPVETLADVFKKNLPSQQTIHYMKVDVEGFEYEALTGNNWARYRPELLCIEAEHVKKDWRPLLKENRYSQVFFDGLNEYYLREESIHRVKLFSYPEAMLSGEQIIKWTVKREFDAITKAYESNVSQLHKQINDLDATVRAEREKYELLTTRYAKAIKLNDTIKKPLKLLKRAHTKNDDEEPPTN